MDTQISEISVVVANDSHIGYVQTILDTIEAAAKVRGTGIAKRSPEYVELKIREGKAIIATCGDEFAGFCYIESWGNKQYVANSGLIVVEKFRQHGLAKRIKLKAFSLARAMFPEAKVFGLTSGAAVMKINTELGYNPVTFAQLTDDESFWRGCQGCINYDVLTRTDRKYCICTAMLFDPAKQKDKKEVKETIKEIKKILKK
ncbi:GNAT family N-acetyltransferase [Dysgonomonas massiliensis]|uniref:GNAT family N-acetyltransferase n=1 Tax=Dysgonomonas massiliensis TaxID=2040292 RepID=UPI00160E7EF5|nr:GNAT family N-acetyltransferase [Dysgonomonas massiliensis]